MTVAAVVLAAGEASRFGSPKQRLLLPRVLERLRETSVDEIVVVEGAYALESPDDSLLVACPEWEQGPGASLRCGLSELGPEVAAAVVVLADGPTLAPQAIERVLDMWRRAGGLVAASYEGERGHPVVIGRADWSNVPDEGLRDLPVTLIPCDDLGAPGDVDLPEDLPERFR
jgi:CTP:molybdopterin cytidylyltransferase MocA